MLEKNKDLENQVNMLLGERQQVVCLNKDDGTMECIAQARSLDYPNSVSGRANSVKDIVDQMQAWLQKYDNRITVKSIFQSLDKGNFGELKPEQFQRALKRMGIALADDELRKLRAVLDQRDIGFMRYMPLVMQLQGVQMMEFINSDVAKIARMVVSRDLTKQQLQQEIDPRRITNMDLRDFTDAIKELRSDDFTFDDT